MPTPHSTGTPAQHFQLLILIFASYALEIGGFLADMLGKRQIAMFALSTVGFELARMSHIAITGQDAPGHRQGANVGFGMAVLLLSVRFFLWLYTDIVLDQ